MAFLITKPLSEQKAETIIEIDEIAGQKRLQYITSAPGQEVTYTAKLTDALAYKAAGYPEDVTTYPWIASESSATGQTPLAVTNLIIYTANLWTLVGSRIEGARQAAKIAVNTATSVTDIRTALTNFKAILANI